MFDLSKGGLFSFEKGIESVRAGLGWEAGSNYDLDVCVIGLRHVNGQPRFHDATGSHAVFYANKALKQADGSYVTADGSIKHYGDNRTGAGDGDDEVVDINFPKLPVDIVEVAVWVSIHEAAARGQNFGGVHNAYLTITDNANGNKLCEFKMRDEFPTATLLQVGSFVKANDIWSFKAVGQGSIASLSDVQQSYMS